MLRRLSCLVLLLSSSTGCSLSVDFDGASFGCADGQCPTGFRCVDERCTRLDGADASAADAAASAADGAMAPDPCNGVDQVADPVSGHCYVLDSTERSFAEARDACAARGPVSHLVFLGSSEESTLVLQLGGGAATRFAWMGASDAAVEGAWRWLDGTAFPPAPGADPGAYVGWHQGEPNDGGTSGEAQDCGALAIGGTFAGDWDDQLCEGLLASICETE